MPERRLIFGQDAAGYDAGRPSYPAELIDHVVGLAGPEGRVIDVGTGTAKSTRLLAARGLIGVGVEPDPAMADHARRYLAPHPGWRIDVSDFEWWRPADGDAPADLVTSAQAWHWVHPEVGLWRAHRLLRPGGHLAVWWNLADIDDRPIRREIDAAYAEHAPGELFSPTINFNQGSPFARAPADVPFVAPTEHLYRWTLTYTTAELLALLHTHSNHRLLAPSQLTPLLNAVATIINTTGHGTYDYPYITRLWTTRAA